VTAGDEATSKSGAASYARRNCASETSETTFFNNMVLLLDYLFVHRLRMAEGKDGDPLNLLYKAFPAEIESKYL
jgi:hypothetical protein